MFGTHDLALFVVSGLLLNFTPGADTLYIVGRSTLQGARAGAVAALGIGAGCCVHMLAAALGLSAVLATSATAFTIVKLIGAAYLVYLGISLWRSGPGTPAARAAPSSPASLRVVFAQGVLTNVLNPKVALFFLAFLPQFVDPDTPHRLLAFLFLGLVFNVNGTLWNLFVAWSTARLGGRIAGTGRRVAWLSRATGTIFVVLGAKLALSERG
jgi:threonine/homoserine/homoserine lactone efflux protein